MDKKDIIKEYGVEKIPGNHYMGSFPPGSGLSPDSKLDLQQAIRDYYARNRPEEVSFVARQLMEGEKNR